MAGNFEAPVKVEGRNRINILGVDIDNLSMAQAVNGIAAAVEAGSFVYAVTPNVDHIMRLRKDDDFREIYSWAGLVLADGMPLVWASRLLRRPLQERVNGTDLFERASELAAQRGYSLYLLGGNPGAARRAGDHLRERYPALKIVGAHCPPVGFEKDPVQNREIQRRIRESGADILFVALGAPKQESWIYRHGRESGVKFAAGIGISFSLIAGDIKRAPAWMQRRGLEWLWRLFSEPRRLWKRYIIDDMPFLGLVLMEILRKCLKVTARPAPL